MVIYYNPDTKEIKRTEDNTIIPVMPANSTLEEQRSYYNLQNEGFISLPYEMGAYIYSFKLCFDVNGMFTGLQPK